MAARNKIILSAILLGALFLRTFRLNDLLGFYYDQGRDAVAVWNLWHKGDFFLIGPTTGIEGIFLGPLFYYLITPAYVLANGNPVGPAILLAIINVFGIYMIFLLGQKYFNTASGLLSAFLLAFSLNQTQSHRWLSNPTPLPLSAALAMWALLQLVYKDQRKRWWILLGLMLGLSLHFEAASAVFFLPAVGLILCWRKIWPNLWGIFAFLTTLLPQIIFDFRNQHILFQAFQRFLLAEKSFKPVFTELLKSRLNFYFETFTSQFVFDRGLAWIFLTSTIVLGVFVWKKINNPSFKILLIWCFIPVVSLLFYHGNNGYVWGYYFTGVYPIVALMVGTILAYAGQSKLGKWIVGLIMTIFLTQNLPPLKNYLSAGTDGPIHITLEPSLAAVDWVYQDAKKRQFNVDVYVPPVIPHAYDYLFLWRGATKYNYQPNTERLSLLYTLYEVDPPHPERLEAWLKRQSGIGVVEEETRFGGIVVQRRHRI